MLRQWMIRLLVSGVAYVSGSPCDGASATKCYTDLVHYESLAFPFYGKDKAELDRTCENINVSFDCVLNYTETCKGSPECDAECRDLRNEMHMFTQLTGLKTLASELCSDYSPLRESYLENYHCLESNADAYSACHNDSQMSMEYLSTIVDARALPLRCCYITWYHGCFYNVTRDNCEAGATFYISLALRHFVGHIADQFCKGSGITCERPPLPASVNDDENSLDKDELDKTNEDMDKTNEDMDKTNEDMDKTNEDMDITNEDQVPRPPLLAPRVILFWAPQIFITFTGMGKVE